MKQMQCIESCRAEGYAYVVVNNVDNKCECIIETADTVKGPLPHQCSDAMKYKVINILKYRKIQL